MDAFGMRPKRQKTDDDTPQVSRVQQNGGMPQHLRTTLFISNLHCPSCVDNIKQTLNKLNPRPLIVSPSIVSHSVAVAHYSTLPVENIVHALESAGFDIHSAFQESDHQPTHQILPSKKLGDAWEDNLEQAVLKWRQSWHLTSKGKEREIREQEAMRRRQKHAEQCPECRLEVTGTTNEVDQWPLKQFNSTQNVRLTQWPSAPAVAALRSTSQADLATTNVDLKRSKTQDDGPYSPTWDILSDEKFGIVVEEAGVEPQTLRAELAIVGMTCSACVGSITTAIEQLPYVRSVNVALLTNSATVVFEGKEHVGHIVEAIEDCGFEGSIESVEEVKKSAKKRQSKAFSDVWKATYAIEGMTCSACTGSVTRAVEELTFVESVDVNLIANSATVIFNGENSLDKIKEAIEDAGFDATLDSVVNAGAESEEIAERTVWIRVDGMYCHHCPNKTVGALEERYLKLLEFEKLPTLQDPIMRIRYTAKPPEFTIRTILTTIEDADPSFRPSIHHPPTIEDKSRELQIRERRRILFRLLLSAITAIPTFIIGVVAMSLLSSNNPIRMYIMEPVWAGSVPRVQWALLILATPVYFFAADTFHRKAFKELRALWRPGSTVPIWKRFIRFGSMSLLMSLGTTIAYFASIAELIMASLQKNVSDMDIDEINNSFYFDSVVFLTFFILIGRYLEAYTKAKTGDAVTSLGNLRPSEASLVDSANGTTANVPVDLLEVGDIVRVPHGTSPPFDGTLIEGETAFDESSLTGESRLVPKKIGETVFSGTVNKQGPISVRISSVSGTSMLDQIIKVVREGQTRRAPVERAADVITSHFVPFVVAVGITTWVVWLALGLSGTLPKDWLDVTMGGWPVWSLKFAIATFVVACPCGIGLAAPTALFVGGGMAAKHGILVKGGGEAFQEASTLDCIVFDKTGTLTQGGEPSVTDYKARSDDDELEILGLTMALEQQSGHPIAGAVVDFCKTKQAKQLDAASVEEVPGMGLIGNFKINAQGSQSINTDVLVGNESLMIKHEVLIDSGSTSLLQSWKEQGKSVVLVAVRASNPQATSKSSFVLSAIFAIADALRPEASSTVAALRSRDVAVWMLSGDNPTTAAAVAAQVGIDPDNVIAGVLPDQKAEKIQYLQKSLPFRGRGKKRATVAMVGDGINDSPALTMADVGIAIGSGSDVAISSADFILISSNLTAMLTLIDLSRAVFRRVWFNFGWALVYNLIAMPVAAGVLYPVVSNGTHVRLDPVWASLAMAMSSVSVVTSSLLLRSRIWGIGFRERKAH